MEPERPTLSQHEIIGPEFDPFKQAELTPEDGGPAFPCEGGDMSGLHAHPGMTLRAWLAGQALAGAMSNWQPSKWRDLELKRMADDAVDAADAALRALSKGSQEQRS